MPDEYGLLTDEEIDRLGRHELAQTVGHPLGFSPNRSRRELKERYAGERIKRAPGLRQAQYRGELESERERSRNLNPLLEARGQQALALGRRSLLEGERRRLSQTESGLGALGLAQSPVGEAFRAEERATTSAQEAQLTGTLNIEALSEGFRAEQDAINRLFQNGENDLAYHRQVRLTQMQLDAAERIAEMQASASLWGDIMKGIFSLGAAAIPGIGPAVAATTAGGFTVKQAV